MGLRQLHARFGRVLPPYGCQDAAHANGAGAAALKWTVAGRQAAAGTQAAETIKVTHDQHDILFAKASGGDATRLEDLTEERIDREFSVIVKDVILTVRSPLPVLFDGASLLNAITADMGLPDAAVYASIKRQSARWLAVGPPI